MGQADDHAAWERRADARRQAEWRAGVDEWRKLVTAELAAIRENQIKREERRLFTREIIAVIRNVFLLIVTIGGGVAVAWQAVVALVRSAGNG